MENINFDEKCLDGLNESEIQSILKSNVISWNIRNKINNILNTKIMFDIIMDSLPLIISAGVVIGIIEKIKELIDQEKGVK